MVVLQSTGKGPFSSYKYGTDLSPRFDTLKDLSLWIWEQPCMQMDFWQFSRNAYICIIHGKLPENYLHVHVDRSLRVSNLGDKYVPYF